MIVKYITYALNYNIEEPIIESCLKMKIKICRLVKSKVKKHLDNIRVN